MSDFMTPVRSTKRLLYDGYDGVPDAPRKAREGRKAAKLAKLGLAQNRLAPVMPKWYYMQPNRTQEEIMHPNYTSVLKMVEGQYNSQNMWQQADPAGNNEINQYVPASFLHAGDGACGVFSWRANLGSENATKVLTNSKYLVEQGLACCNIPSTMLDGTTAFLRTLHLKFTVKILSPYQIWPSGWNNLAEWPRSMMYLTPVKCRFMIVRQKRERMGYNMYSGNDLTQGNDNLVGQELFLDPVGRPFGINDPNYNYETVNKAKDKPQTAKQHFTSPVQKKFFDVLMSTDFTLFPEVSQPAAGYKQTESGLWRETPPNFSDKPYPSTKNIDVTIPINELVNYRPAVDQPPISAATTMFSPADLNMFDTKVICYAYCPNDMATMWQRRCSAGYAGPPSTATTETDWDMAPHIQITHHGVLQYTDNP